MPFHIHIPFLFVLFSLHPLPLYAEEVWVLLKGQEDMNGTNVSAYSRADVCEVRVWAISLIAVN